MTTWTYPVCADCYGDLQPAMWDWWCPYCRVTVHPGKVVTYIDGDPDD